MKKIIALVLYFFISTSSFAASNEQPTLRIINNTGQRIRLLSKSIFKKYLRSGKELTIPLKDAVDPNVLIISTAPRLYFKQKDIKRISYYAWKGEDPSYYLTTFDLFQTDSYTADVGINQFGELTVNGLSSEFFGELKSRSPKKPNVKYEIKEI